MILLGTVVVLVLGALVVIEYHEHVRRDRSRLRRRAQEATLRLVMDMHPTERKDWVPYRRQQRQP